MSNPMARSVRASNRASHRSLLQMLRLKAFGRRRRLLVHRSYQLRTALRSVLGTSLLVGLLIFVLNQVNRETSRDMQQMAPFMRPGLERWDRITFLSLILGGAVFLVGVFVLELLATHRTAGAFQNLRRRLEELRSGRLAAHLKLRRHDHFPELDKAFNDAVASLRTRTEGEIATLGRLSSQARELIKEHDRGNPARARALAEALQQSLEEMRCRKSELLEP
jgi:methyl-accepting chemotaxis protein